MKIERESNTQEQVTKFLLILFLVTWGPTFLLPLLGFEGDGLILLAIVGLGSGAITTVLGLVAAYTFLGTHSWLKPGIYNSF